MNNRANKKIWLASLLLASSLLADTFMDKERGLMWQDDVSVTKIKKNWNGAIEHCEALAHAGHKDWRLPTRMELHSITDKSKVNPAVKNGIKHVATSDYYWSSSPSVSDPSAAWFVNFKYGLDYWRSKSNSYLVRCVRDSQ